VVVGEEILLLKRRTSRSFGDRWGIPTGKIDHQEGPLQAIIRELFEETGILTSEGNLEHVGDYFVVNSAMSFRYSLFLFHAEEMPKIKISPEEHTDSVWIARSRIEDLPLIPDVDLCLREIEAFLRRPAGVRQLPLFSEMVQKEGVSLPHYPGRPPERWYCAFGPPGSGKSTLLKLLAEADPAFLHIADTLGLRTDVRVRQLLLELFGEGQHRLFFEFQVRSLAARLRATVGAPEMSLVDESIHSTLAYSIALRNLNWLSDSEFEAFISLYQSLVPLVPPPRMIFYLTARTETLLRRMNRRRRKHEQHYEWLYVEELRLSFAETAQGLAQSLEVVEIATDEKSPSEIIKSYGLAGRVRLA
jgi:8-oxo-dGTP pyrophosphatase MutT (NUDIX family)/deoxyadenosine/deoxycytidine kinase